MKKTVFIALLIIANIPVQGQVRFGLKGGMNVSGFNISTKQDLVVDFSNRFAFHVGGFAEIPVGGFFSVQPELLFSSKGARCEILNTYTYPPVYGRSDDIYRMRYVYHPGYIELPVYLKAGFEAGQGKFMVGIGPYFAYGVGGKLKANMKINTSLSETFPPEKLGEKLIAVGKGERYLFKADQLKMDVTQIDLYLNISNMTEEDLFDKNLLVCSSLKRFDAGFVGFIGYEFDSGFSLTAGYQIGFNNINNSDENDDNIKNRTISLSVGYKF